MKFIKTILAVSLLIGLFVVPRAMAQSDTNAAPYFWTQIFGWGTSIDTNNTTTFVNAKCVLDVGVESRVGDGISLANDVHGSYDLYISSTNSGSIRFGPDALERNSGVGGTFVSAEAGIQAAYVLNDFRLGASVDGGYWANNPSVRHHMFGEVNIDAKKAVGGSRSRAFLGARFSQEFPRSAQGYCATTGFSF